MWNILDFQKWFEGLQQLSVVPPELYFLSLYIKLLILLINNCFCYHLLSLISSWYTMWQLLLQPDVIFPLSCVFQTSTLPSSHPVLIFQPSLSHYCNQTKIQAPLSPHINPSLVSYLQLCCLIQGLFSVSISHRLCCCISSASQRLAINELKVNVTLLFTLSSSLSTFPSFLFTMGSFDSATKMLLFPSLFWFVSTFVLSF